MEVETSIGAVRDDVVVDKALTKMGMPQKECALEKGFHNCPFESEDPEEWTDANPCAMSQCDGASLARLVT